MSKNERDLARVILDRVAAQARARAFREVRARFAAGTDMLIENAKQKFDIETPFDRLAPEPRPVVADRAPRVGQAVVAERGEQLERPEHHAARAERALHPAAQILLLIVACEAGEALALQIEQVCAVLENPQHPVNVALDGARHRRHQAVDFRGHDHRVVG